MVSKPAIAAVDDDPVVALIVTDQRMPQIETRVYFVHRYLATA